MHFSSRTQLKVEQQECCVAMLQISEELESKSTELAAHTSQILRISSNQFETFQRIGAGGWGEVLEGKIRVAAKCIYTLWLPPPQTWIYSRERWCSWLTCDTQTWCSSLGQCLTNPLLSSSWSSSTTLSDKHMSKIYLRVPLVSGHSLK